MEIKVAKEVIELLLWFKEERHLIGRDLRCRIAPALTDQGHPMPGHFIEFYVADMDERWRREYGRKDMVAVTWSFAELEEDPAAQVAREVEEFARRNFERARSEYEGAMRRFAAAGLSVDPAPVAGDPR